MQHRWQSFVRFFLILKYACLFVLLTTPLWAEEHMIFPDLRVRTTYDDNVFFDEVSDFELLASPTLTYRMLHETGLFQLSAGADVYRYLEETQYDRVNQRYNLVLDHELTPTLAAGMEARFAVDHTFTTELQEFGLVTDKNRRKLYSASPHFTWDLNPRHTLKMDLRWKRVDYSDSADSDDRDYNNYGLSLALFREWTERIFLVGQVSGDLTELDDQVLTATDASGDSIKFGSFDERHYSIEALAGVDYEMSEILDLSLRFGGGRTEIESEEKTLQFMGPLIVGTQSMDADEGEWQYLFRARLDWQQEYFHLGLVGSRDFIPRFDGENIKRTRFQVYFDYDIGARFVLEAWGSYVQSKSVGGNDDISEDEVDAQSYAFSPGLRYRITPDCSLAAHYEYRGIDDDVDDEFQNRQRIWLELSYRWPLLL